MLTSVDLNDYSRRMTGEVRTDRRLAPKVMLLEWSLPQMLPELHFGFGRITTQSPGAGHAIVNRTLRSSWHAPPTPDPSPPRATRAGGGEKQCARHYCAHREPSATAPPAAVCTQASPQAFASSRTRRM